MSRYFTLIQAEQQLPAVERAIRDAVALKAEYSSAENNIQKATQRIVNLGGSIANRDQFMAERSRRDAASEALQTAIEQIHGFGCQVKDLDIGLIDFPTLYRGQEVLLCWKLGEDGIRFWHGVEEGFRGRKAIDQDFLDNHRGDDIN